MAAITESGRELTDRQAAHLLRLAFKYRRQLAAATLAMAFDEMERLADQRVAEGKGALPDFRKADRPVKTRRVRRVPAAELDQLSLFGAPTSRA